MSHYAPKVKHKVPALLLYMFMLTVVNNLDCVESIDAGKNFNFFGNLRRDLRSVRLYVDHVAI